MGKFLSDQGIDVVCAILSIFPESRSWNRENLKDYVEVYIDTPLDVLVERDSKGLYKRALAGEIQDVVGVDIEFPVPQSPDLILDNGKPLRSVQDLALEVIDYLDAQLA